MQEITITTKIHTPFGILTQILETKEISIMSFKVYVMVYIV